MNLYIQGRIHELYKLSKTSMQQLRKKVIYERNHHMASVIEELDKFKRGNEDINFQAREFLRQVDDLTGEALSRQGAPLGPQME